MKGIDWQKDAIDSMWFLSAREREMRGCKMTAEEREAVKDALKRNVARYVRMATQKTAGQRGLVSHLNTLDTLGHTSTAIIIAAVDLCLDGALGAMPESIEGDVIVEQGTEGKAES